MERCKRSTKVLYVMTLLSGLLECMFFAGIVFGFASLVFVLKEEGYFSQLCSSSPGTNWTDIVQDCSGQDEKFALVFTIASFLNNFMVLFSGIVFDRFGTLVTRLLAINIYCIGTVLVAVSNAKLSVLLFPALSCIAVGGMLLMMTNLQVGNLFAAHRSTIITLYSGAFDSSAAVFLIIKVLHQHGITLRRSFVFLSFCSIIHIVRTALLLPHTRIPYPVPPCYTYGLSLGKNKYNVEQRMRDVLPMSNVSSGRSNAPEDETEVKESGKDLVKSFQSCVLSWFFVWNLLWLSIMQLRHFIFIGTLNPKLVRLANNDNHLVSHYTNVFSITQLCAVLCAPWNGLLLDRHKGKPRAPGATEQEADLRSSILSLFLTSLQCLLFSVCASVPSLPVQFLTFALEVINRSFIYGGNAAFINIAFPICHFGKLYGLTMSLSAVISLLQYPCLALFKGALDGDNIYADMTLSLVTMLGFIHPLYVFVHCWKLAQARKNRQPVAL
ncbi:solute carrier family 43 member 3a [Dunckerocampus dactyliophorus]|uniref:solute carrier family 43 member 3a n=1 Tax=Dunckerocampus dactyliophorus TaxID=161453 RepID=UPI002405391F|nr:solute carrier family 43 member 3a [Dunckerocampus dactyliophorus]